MKHKMHVKDINDMALNQETAVSTPMPNKPALEGLFNEDPIPLHSIKKVVPMGVEIYDSQEKFTEWGILNGLEPLKWEGIFRFNGDITNNLDLQDALEILLARYISAVKARWTGKFSCRTASNRAAIVSEVRNAQGIRYIGVAIRWEN